MANILAKAEAMIMLLPEPMHMTWGAFSKSSTARRTIFGSTTGGVQVLELARSRGIATVLITRYPKSPAAKLADVVLRCGSNEGPFQFGSVPAKVAQLVVMDVLFQEYCHRNRERCEDNIQRIAAALSDKHL